MSFGHDVQKKNMEKHHTLIRAEIMYLNSRFGLLLYLPKTSHISKYEYEVSKYFISYIHLTELILYLNFRYRIPSIHRQLYSYFCTWKRYISLNF